MACCCCVKLVLSLVSIAAVVMVPCCCYFFHLFFFFSLALNVFNTKLGAWESLNHVACMYIRVKKEKKKKDQKVAWFPAHPRFQPPCQVCRGFGISSIPVARLFFFDVTPLMIVVQNTHTHTHTLYNDGSLYAYSCAFSSHPHFFSPTSSFLLGRCKEVLHPSIHPSIDMVK